MDKIKILLELIHNNSIIESKYISFQELNLYILPINSLFIINNKEYHIISYETIYDENHIKIYLQENDTKKDLKKLYELKTILN